MGPARSCAFVDNLYNINVIKIWYVVFPNVRVEIYIYDGIPWKLAGLSRIDVLISLCIVDLQGPCALFYVEIT